MLRFNRYSPILDRRFNTRGKTAEVEIYFGKVDWNGRGQKANAITIEIRWDEENKSFAASGNVWNRSGTDIICGGQCIDEIYGRHFDFGEAGNKAMEVIHRLWKTHHLNDLRPGTEEQEAYLDSSEEYKKSNHDYDVAVKVLKAAGLYEVPDPRAEGKMYAYGTGWLTRKIPEADVELIRKFFKV